MQGHGFTVPCHVVPRATVLPRRALILEQSRLPMRPSSPVGVGPYDFVPISPAGAINATGGARWRWSAPAVEPNDEAAPHVVGDGTWLVSAGVKSCQIPCRHSVDRRLPATHRQPRTAGPYFAYSVLPDYLPEQAFCRLKVPLVWPVSDASLARKSFPPREP